MQMATDDKGAFSTESYFNARGSEQPKDVAACNFHMTLRKQLENDPDDK